MRAPINDLHVSNMITYASLAAGLAAVAASGAAGSPGLAPALLAVAALADTFDGRFARRFTRTDRQARTGAETDNLADAIVFGLVPVVVVGGIIPPPDGVRALAWWSAAFLYLLAVVVRLGFFAVEGDEKRFVGLPTPAAALIWSTVLIWSPSAGVCAGVFVTCAAAMVSPVAIPRPRGAGLALFAVWAAGLVAWHLAG
jgi:phosphatidylserine synthase